MPALADAPVAPGARAVARYVRTSAMKARRMVNLIRGLPAKEALTLLKFAPQAASLPVYKVVESAIANAENNEELDGDALVIAEAYVDEGPTLRRFRPRAQGRAYRIRKRTCHITVVVEAVAPSEQPRRRPAKAAGGRKAAAGDGPAPAKKSGKQAGKPAAAEQTDGSSTAEKETE